MPIFAEEVRDDAIAGTSKVRNAQEINIFGRV
jgi:hypothetical protein